jgi:glycosyltransferase involved in cell wall biosynthesis
MSSPSLVTLVTPTYNQAGYLPETLDSVLAQTHPALEYIVIDDGSRDETPEVMARYAGRLTALRHDNMGQAATLNKGWAMARGRYIGYLSSDDLLLPHAVERLAGVLDARPDVVCVFPDSDLIDARSQIIRRAVCRPFDLEDTVVQQECYIGPGALFRREAFETVGGWRPELRLAPDREFWMRLAALGRIEFLQESLALYRTHPESTSFTAASEAASQEYLRVLDEFYARPSVSDSLLRRKGEAYARASLLLARNALWRGEFGSALRRYRQACRQHPLARAPGTLWRLLRQGASLPAKIVYTRLARLARRR